MSRKCQSHRLCQSWAFLVCIVSAVCVDSFVQPITTQSICRQVTLGHPLKATADNAFEDQSEEIQSTTSQQRRNLIKQSMASLFLLPQLPLYSFAEETSAASSAIPQPSEPYVREPTPKEKFSYTVTPPPTFVPGNKPLKTHLDEINFSSPDISRYTIGITVDPVRISSIGQFGTPEEVAARVVTAEVNRDGVFKVTLAKDPKEDAEDGGCYDVEYISEGKRGTKRFATRIFVRDGFLYVLTVQIKEKDFDGIREKEVMDCVKSFKPL